MWFNIDCIINNIPPEYSGPYPPYFESSAYPWTSVTGARFREILDEYQTYRKQHTLKPYFYEEQSGHTGKWKTVPLLTWGIRRKNQQHFPRTMAILQDIPGIVSISFSLLEAGGEIQPHHGDSDTYIRGHLCLSMAEEQESLAFHVNGINRHWHPGSWLLFCDAYRHGGWNHSMSERIVVIADIIHPEYGSRKNLICARILTGLSLNFITVKFQIRNLQVVPRSLIKLTQLLLESAFRVLLFLKVRL